MHVAKEIQKRDVSLELGHKQSADLPFKNDMQLYRADLLW